MPADDNEDVNEYGPRVSAARPGGSGNTTTYPALGIWSLRARCYQLGLDADLFFEDPVQKVVKDACEACPVRSECREYALVQQPHGYWGGTTPRERRRVRRRERSLSSLATGAVGGAKCPSCQVYGGFRVASKYECAKCGATWPAV